MNRKIHSQPDQHDGKRDGQDVEVPDGQRGGGERIGQRDPQAQQDHQRQPHPVEADPHQPRHSHGRQQRRADHVLLRSHHLVTFENRDPGQTDLDPPTGLPRRLTLGQHLVDHASHPANRRRRPLEPCVLTQHRHRSQVPGSAIRGSEVTGPLSLAALEPIENTSQDILVSHHPSAEFLECHLDRHTIAAPDHHHQIRRVGKGG